MAQERVTMVPKVTHHESNILNSSVVKKKNQVYFYHEVDSRRILTETDRNQLGKR